MDLQNQIESSSLPPLTPGSRLCAGASRNNLLLACFLSLILSLLFFRIMGMSVFSGIDGSFDWALNALHSLPLKYGADIASTYGPLGYLDLPMPFNNNIECANILSLAVTAIFGLATARLLICLQSVRKSITFFALFCFAFWIAGNLTLDYRILCTCILCIVSSFLQADSAEDGSREHKIPQAKMQIDIWSSTVLVFASALASITLFIKFNIGVLCCATLFIAAAITFFRQRSALRIAYICAIALFFFIVAALSLVFFGSPSGLITFIVRCGEIASPYSQTMSTFEQRSLQLYSAIVFMCINFAAALYFAKTKSKLAIALFLMVIPLFLSFKHAFIRVDNLFSFAFVASLALAVAVAFAKRRSEYIVLAVMGALLLTFVPCRFEPQFRTNRSFFMGAEDLWKLLNYSEYRANLEKLTASNYASEKLPESWLAELRKAKRGVDCVPFNTFLCPANNLKWCPPPVTQLYIAHHPKLDYWTSEFYRSQSRPDFLIAEFPDVDWRHPFFTCPQSWHAIFQNYLTIDLSAKQQLLLGSRKRPLLETTKALSLEKFGANEWVPIPQSHNFVFAKIIMLKNRTGALREILYRTDPVFIDIAYKDGKYGNFRILPLQAENGILFNYLPRTMKGMKDLFSLKPSEEAIHFKISGPGLSSLQKLMLVQWSECSYKE